MAKSAKNIEKVVGKQVLEYMTTVWVCDRVGSVTDIQVPIKVVALDDMCPNEMRKGPRGEGSSMWRAFHL